MSPAKAVAMDPQQQIDTRAIEIAAGTASRLDGFEKLVGLQITHVSQQVDAQGRALEKQASAIAENHTAVLAAIKDQAGVEATKRGSIYAFKDKVGAFLIVSMGSGMIAMAIYIFTHGVK